ncbi:polysaccharide pyruvyl transferase family protein [Butyrivibrio sp. LB2008]|uniref:polysaccharide pyruvyl transferase family protein n=1 Tax=Butyrivibrio sp. LB2008 TaxID=1408305 RepID=UPI000479F7D6|nr:polysaccharide pyruvyl transferase family protein [Butyrivibrio sp. LB2008]
MIKVGIATFQFADNYGAVLQCFALNKAISMFEDVSVNVINYFPYSFAYRKVYESEYDKVRWYSKRKKFKEFLIEQCGMDEQTTNIIDGRGYDVVCVGSDQIWNPKWDYKEYLLQHVGKNVKKISYAASLGCSVNEAMVKKEFFDDALSKFANLSVREEEHTDFISEMSGIKCECVLDPTLLLDVDLYNDLLEGNDFYKESKNDYIFFYWLDHDQNVYKTASLVNEIASRRGLKVKHTVWQKNSEILFPDGECVFYESIEGFLSLIKNAAYVITNSYHGTIFSIKFGVPFYTYVVESMKSRFSTLLTYGDIKERLFVSELPQINDDIDFELINKKINDKREDSIRYLKNAVMTNSLEKG